MVTLRSLTFGLFKELKERHIEKQERQEKSAFNPTAV